MADSFEKPSHREPFGFARKIWLIYSAGVLVSLGLVLIWFLRFGSEGATIGWVVFVCCWLAALINAIIDWLIGGSLAPIGRHYLQVFGRVFVIGGSILVVMSAWPKPVPDALPNGFAFTYLIVLATETWASIARIKPPS